MRRRAGFTLVEVAVVAVLIVLVVSIAAAIVHQARMTFLADELSHAVEGAAVLGRALEEDLRQAIRDPRTSEGLRVGHGRSLYVSFYRAVPAGEGQMLVAVPTRWVLEEEGERAFLTRITWDAGSAKWERTSFRSAPIAMSATPGTTGTGPGFRVVGDSGSDEQRVEIAVLARTQPASGPGTGQDRATIGLVVHLPEVDPVLVPLFEPKPSLDDLPE